MKKILSGVKPSELFKEMIRVSPGVKNHDIAMAFRDAFPDVDGVAINAIWGWQREGREGLSDEVLNAILFDCLKSADYL